MGAEIDLFTSYASGGLAVRSAPLVSLPDSPISAPRMPRSRHDADDSGACATDGSIKAVLVDVEDVLYDASAWQRWLGQLFAPLTPRTLESEFQQRWQAEFLPAVYRGQQDFHAAFASCLSALGLTAGHVEEIVAASRAQRRRDAGARRPYPGTRSTLSQLKSAGITCGVLTNTDRTAAALRQDLGKLGLADAFDEYFTSVDMQAHLPASSCFDHALQAVNVAAADVLFVSHDIRELQGAQAAGCQAVAFNARPCVAGIPKIDRFDGLMKLAVPAEVARVAT
jgi:HAD superfamily hydrolase (TIGR01509 family)